MKEIIRRWPCVNDLAKDLDEKADTVRKWKDRNSIPACKWFALLAAAKKRRIKLTCSELVDAAK